MSEQTVIEAILDAAHWAPSGDNTQPWRFQVTGEHSFSIYGNDTRDWVVYDLQGHASQLALGCMLENICIAAEALGYRADIRLDEAFAEDRLMFHVDLQPAEKGDESGLYEQIPSRCVQRLPMGTEPLSKDEKEALEAVLPSGYSLYWLESATDKKQVARLMFGNAYTRLSMKEGFDVHSKIIDWGKSTSEDKIPDKSLGLDPVTLKLMRWSLAKWERFNFMATYLGGTLMPRFKLDYLPALKSCAHFVLLADKEAETVEEYIAAGRALQRFWLMSDKLKLGFQPEQTPVIFSEYVRRDVPFTDNEKTLQNAREMDQQFCRLIGEERVQRAVFMGRLGRTAPVVHRSVRLPLSSLVKYSS